MSYKYSCYFIYNNVPVWDLVFDSEIEAIDYINNKGLNSYYTWGYIQEPIERPQPIMIKESWNVNGDKARYKND